MLFIVTGDVQTGKTRWLSGVVDELMEEGVVCFGVLAPGRWREGGFAGGASGKKREKTGIDNVLLPSGERIAFAQRRDIARRGGTYDTASQSAQARLAWEISDAAIQRVNSHFDTLLRGVPGAAAGTPGRGIAGALGAAAGAGLLVVDELGRLELGCEAGLTSAVRVLKGGPAAGFGHAVAVVRPSLVGDAAALFSAAWQGVEVISPGEEARCRIRSLLCR